MNNIKRLILKLIAGMKAFHSSVLEEAGAYQYYSGFEGKKLLASRCYIECFWSNLVCYLRYLICSRIGHAYEDQGYAGPESGAIDMVCKRCDHSSHTQLY